MKFSSQTRSLFAVAIFATGAGMDAAQTNSSGPAKATEQKPVAATAEKKGAASATDLQKLVEQLGTHRDTMIADSEALAKQLKDATDAQKKTILEKLEAQKKSFEQATSALQKQIADERRKQRKGAAPKR